METYAEIMARLNGQQSQAPKAANDFTAYVQKLLLEPNPQGNMLSDSSDYYADPFRRQNAINASLDEALKKKQEEEARLAAQSASNGGMLGGGSGGSDRTELTPEQIAFLDAETPEERYARITGDWFGLKPLGMMMVDPAYTFLTQARQKPAPVVTLTGKTPAQIAEEQRALEAEAARAAAAAAQQEAARVAAVQRAAQQTAANAAANYQSSNYQSYTPSGGGYTGMSSDNSNAGTSGSPSYGSGGFL